MFKAVLKSAVPKMGFLASTLLLMISSTLLLISFLCLGFFSSMEGFTTLGGGALAADCHDVMPHHEGVVEDGSLQPFREKGGRRGPHFHEPDSQIPPVFDEGRQRDSDSGRSSVGGAYLDDGPSSAWGDF